MSRTLTLPLALITLTCSISASQAVVGPNFHEDPALTAATAPHTAAPAPAAPKFDPIDRIKGIGQFKFGAKLTDFPPGLLRPVDPKAKAGMLAVSPYGDNFLVTDVTGLTWGNIPVAGLLVTFHEGVLIDLEVALKSKNVDFYVVDRAFKEKYGPSDPRCFPVECWNGDITQVTILFDITDPPDADSFDQPGKGKLELLDLALWNKIEKARIAKAKQELNANYQTLSKKVIPNL